MRELSYGYGCLVKQCQSLADARKLHALIARDGYGTDTFVANLVVEMYARCGSIEEAATCFAAIASKNIFSWNIAIAVFARNGHFDVAMDCFRRMQCEGILPDDFTLSSIIGPASRIPGARNHCLLIHEIFLRRRRWDSIVAAAMIQGYGRCDMIDEARSILREEEEIDASVWNSLMAVCCWIEGERSGLEILWKMHQMGVRADGFSYSTAIGACTALEDFAQGWILLGQIQCLELDRDNQTLAVAMIEMLAKNGRIDEACGIFQRVRPPRTLILWNAMIAALAQGGKIGAALQLLEILRGEEGLDPDPVSWTTIIAVLNPDRGEEEALNLFRRMDLEGIKPDRVTFVAMINTCSDSLRNIHARIDQSGFSSFLEIQNALIARYSQRGALNDALSIFASLGHRRDVISWSTMLEAFAQHGRGDESIHLFHQMQQEGIDPNGITCLSLLSACRHAGFLDEEALRFAGSMEWDYGIRPGEEHRACVVDLLGRAGRFQDAGSLMLRGPSSPAGEAAWTIFLGGCSVDRNYAGQALEIAQEQASAQGFESSQFTVLLSNICRTL